MTDFDRQYANAATIFTSQFQFGSFPMKGVNLAQSAAQLGKTPLELVRQYGKLSKDAPNILVWDQELCGWIQTPIKDLIVQLEVAEKSGRPIAAQTFVPLEWADAVEQAMSKALDATSG